MEEKEQPKFTESLKNILEIVAGIGALVGFLYAIGLLLLALQVTRTYQTPFSTTWYAANLVPQPIVIGQGLRVGFLGLIIMIGFTLGNLIAPMPMILKRETETVIEESSSGKATNKKYKSLSMFWFGSVGIPKFVVKSTLIIMILFAALYAGLLARIDVEKFGSSFSTIIYCCCQGFAMVLLIVFGNFLASYYRVVDRHNSIPWALRIIQNFVTFYIIVFVIAMIRGELKEPPLTKIEIREGAAVTHRGRLLSHIDSYWHIIKDSGEIVAISDDTAKTVKIPKD